MTNQELVSAVLEHANQHYNEGWDFIVEGWTTEEIAEEMLDCETVETAIKRMQWYIDLYHEVELNTRCGEDTDKQLVSSFQNKE